MFYRMASGSGRRAKSPVFTAGAGAGAGAGADSTAATKIEKKEKIWINILKYKNKYEEWRVNSNWGIITDPVSQGVSIYQGIDKLVAVNFAQPTLNTHGVPIKDFFPIFKWVRVGDMRDFPDKILPGGPTYLDVGQGTFKIVDDAQTLRTTGLGSCTALAMKIGSKKFLTHLDATTNIAPIISAIQREISLSSGPSTITNITVHSGGMDGYAHAIQKANDILIAIKIPLDSPTVSRHSVTFMDEIYI